MTSAKVFACCCLFLAYLLPGAHAVLPEQPQQCDLQDIECQSSLIDSLLKISRTIPRTSDDISKMLNLRNRLLAVQKSYTEGARQTDESRRQALQALQKWSEENWHSASVKANITERGAALLAARDLQPGDKVVNFRTTDVLSSLTAGQKYSCLTVDPESEVYVLTWKSWPLMLDLAAQYRKPDSGHLHYVQSLPVDLSMSQRFDLEDFELLNHTILFEQAIHSSAVSMWMYCLIMRTIRASPSCAAAGQLQDLALRDFLWAYMVVVSRQFNGGFSGGKFCVCMRVRLLTFLDNHLLDLHAIFTGM